MSTPWIMIHGITSVAEGRLVEAAGADAVGIDLVDAGPHGLRLDEAAEIVAALTIETVAVVDNTDPEYLRQVACVVEPTRLQFLSSAPVGECPLPWYRTYNLHGREILAMLKDAEADRFVVRVRRNQLPPKGEAFLKDRSLLYEIGRAGRMILGGELTLDTIPHIMRMIRPWGIELSAAVEEESGAKDWKLVSAFIKAARES